MQHPPQKTNTNAKHAGQGTGSDILACTCPDAFQDTRYGAGQRVMNRCKDGWRCTCGRPNGFAIGKKA